jgi:hypothetical protein
MTFPAARPRPRGATTPSAPLLPVSLLAGALALSGAVAGAPAAAGSTHAAPATARPAAASGADLKNGFPGYFSSLRVVEETLPATADHFTVEADFCVHPDARAGDTVGFDLLWDVPISDWDELAGRPQTFTSTVPVANDAGETLVRATMVHDAGEPAEDGAGILELKTAIDLALAPGAVHEGGCGTLTLPVPAPILFADGTLDPEEPLPGELDPSRYEVEFIDPDGVRSADVLTLVPSDFAPGEAWTDGIVDFTGSAQWALVTPSGPSAATSIALTGPSVCTVPFETAILTATDQSPTNLEPDVQVECEGDVKTFTLENRLRADRQWVVIQGDPRRGTLEDPATISAEFVLDGRSTVDTASVAVATASGRLHGAWVAPQGCTAPRFADVPSRSYAREAVRWMQCRGITAGYANGTFRPDRPITRGETLAFLYRHAGSPAITEEDALWMDPGFLDVDEDSPSYEAVLWAYGMGMTQGRADGTFGLHSPIMRGEYAAFLARAAAANPRVNPEDAPDASGFADVPAGHAFAAEVGWLRHAGLVTGYADRTFRPGRQVTRGETAAMLHRYHVDFVRRG